MNIKKSGIYVYAVMHSLVSYISDNDRNGCGITQNVFILAKELIGTAKLSDRLITTQYTSMVN
jgi:hypothetical protein